MSKKYKTHLASSIRRGASPWSLKQRFTLLLWEYCWILLCLWTPKPFYKWRILILKLFRAKVDSNVFVHQRAQIQIPWNIELKNGVCLGDKATLYSLDKIIIGEKTIIAQEAYLCTGTHDLSSPELPLQTAPIIIGKNCFLGARSFIMPGLSIGENCIVGACAVVVKDIPEQTTVVGNPARIIDQNISILKDRTL